MKALYTREGRNKGQPDPCYYICYKKDRRLIWEKVGKISEGYTPDLASELRTERLKALRHGNKIMSPKKRHQRQNNHNKPFGEVASEYFKVKGPTLKGLVTDKNRYEKHLAEKFNSKKIDEITPQMLEELKAKLAVRKAATVWNVLELFRRIINFGFKVKLCPPLGFYIDMPTKDSPTVSPQPLPGLLNNVDPTKKQLSTQVSLIFTGPNTMIEVALEAMRGLGFETVGDIASESGEAIDWQSSLHYNDPAKLPGQILAGARFREGLTQVALSKLTSIHRRHISEMENGRRTIGKSNAQKLAEVLNIDPRQLLKT